MKESLLEILCCPLDKDDLTLEMAEYDDDSDEIVSGTLVCVGCGERYPIEDGIPNLLPPDMREESPA